MSMDKSAIEAIQQAQAIEAAAQASASVIEQIGTGETPFVALPENMKLINLEKYLPNRVRHRGAMATSIMSDFSRYVIAVKEAQGTACFIDPERMTAKVFFNLGTKDAPGHADFTARLALEKSSEYRELLTMDNSLQSQKAMAEWFEDWKDFLQFFGPDGEAIEGKTAVSATRRMTIESARKEDHEAGNFRASRSAMESIEARSEHGMPHGFRFTCVPYNGLNERSFECRIAIRTGGDAPGFGIRIKQLELEKERMSEEFMEKLEREFKDSGVAIYRGAFEA